MPLVRGGAPNTPFNYDEEVYFMRSRKNVIYVYLSDNEKKYLDKQIQASV